MSISSRANFRLAAASLTLGLALLAATNAEATVFSNPAPVAIPGVGTIGAGAPFPSQIIVSGFSGTVDDIDISLFGLSHTFVRDVAVLLVGPNGQNVYLMADAGGGGVSGIDLTFDQDASNPLPDCCGLTSGTYQPTDGNPFDVDSFPAPAPNGPWGTSLDVFDDTDPNGIWSLYIADAIGGDAGSLDGGWSITLTSAPTDVPEPATLSLFGLGLASLGLIRRRKNA
jgi:subtilisin-like proprotein convertase family protein